MSMLKNNFINFLLNKKEYCSCNIELNIVYAKFSIKVWFSVSMGYWTGVLRGGKDSSSVRSDYHKISEIFRRNDFLNSISYNGPNEWKLIFENELLSNAKFYFLQTLLIEISSIAANCGKVSFVIYNFNIIL